MYPMRILFGFLIMFFVIMFLFSCKEKPKIPILTTNLITEVSTISAVSGGFISDDGGDAVISKGICLSTSDKPTIENSKTIAVTESNSFSCHLAGLTPKTLYYVRAYATNSAGTGYGELISFTTLGDSPVTIATNASDITAKSAILNSSVNPNLLSTAVSFEWGTTTNYGNIVSVNQPVNATTSVNVNITITNLLPKTIYHYRIKAENSIGISYSNDMTFTTMGDIPGVTSNYIKNLLINEVTLNGRVNPNYLATTVSFEWGTTTAYGNITDQNTVNGNSTMDVSANLTGLIPGTTYHYRVKAINELGTTYSEDFTFTTYEMVDVDNNYYHTVTIGTQTWMKENLKTTKYNDNENIPLITNNTEWINLNTPAYCWYDNNEILYKYAYPSYGALYNWYSVSTGKLCPQGWHVPSDAEWTILTDYLGGLDVSGYKLKETGTSHWVLTNSYATNETGFTALPAGVRLNNGSEGVGYCGAWWTATANATDSWMRIIYRNNNAVLRGGNIKSMGMSVRCIKD